MRRRFALLLLAIVMPGDAAFAQDAATAGGGEIIVTGARREIDGYEASIPAVGLRKRADFALLEVRVGGDTRDADKRHDEMYAMIRGAIELADKRGIQLATGDTIVEPLTLANYRALTFKKDNRPDSDRVIFMIKTPLTAGTDAKAATARIDAFVKAVPTVGRAQMEVSGDLTLSVVNPDQYREQIIGLIANEAKAITTKFGPDYAVEARGADRPVEWSRAGATDVFLYVPYQITIVPGRR